MERTPQELALMVKRFNIHNAYDYVVLFNKTDSELNQTIQQVNDLKATGDIVQDSRKLMQILGDEELVDLLDHAVRERQSDYQGTGTEVSIVLKMPLLISVAFIFNQLIELFNKPLRDFELRKRLVAGDTITEDGVDLTLRFEILPRAVHAAALRICDRLAPEL